MTVWQPIISIFFSLQISFYTYIFNSNSDLKRLQFLHTISHLLGPVCFSTGSPWGYSLASLATSAYKVRGNADRLVIALVCMTTRDTALTTAVTSAARCVWMCALASVQETAATPSVLSAWHRNVSHFLPPSKLKHPRHKLMVLFIMEHTSDLWIYFIYNFILHVLLVLEVICAA